MRHNAMNFMRMVGPVGLEPGDVGCGSLLDFLSRTYPTDGADGREDGLPLDEKAGCPTYTPPPYWPPGSHT
jgi:hypothetical protein